PGCATRGRQSRFRVRGGGGTATDPPGLARRCRPGYACVAPALVSWRLCIGRARGGKQREGLLKAIAIVLFALVVLLLGAAVLLFRGGISAKLEPTRLEEAVARRLLRAGLPRAARALRCPVAPTKG